MPDYSSYPKYIEGSGDQYFIDDNGIKRQVPRNIPAIAPQKMEPVGYGGGFGRVSGQIQPQKEDSVFTGSALRQTPIWPVLDLGEDLYNKHLKGKQPGKTNLNMNGEDDARTRALKRIIGGYG